MGFCVNTEGFVGIGEVIRADSEDEVQDLDSNLHQRGLADVYQ